MKNVLNIYGDLYIDKLDASKLVDDGIEINVRGDVIVPFADFKPADGENYIEIKNLRIKSITAYANI